jgi:hypothetical protein
MPFNKEQFIDIFIQYNNAVFPVQIFLFILALAAVYFASGKYSFKNKAVTLILSFLWLWMGIVYHFIFFTKINNGAYLFSLLFILQGILFFISLIKGSLVFEYKKNMFTLTGVLLILYALVIYPVLGYFFGHIYPASPTFGLPCPTTIFTFGILLWTGKKVPVYLLIIPVLWSLLGFSAVMLFGIYEDIGLLASSIIAITALFIRSRKLRESQLINV